MYYKILFLNYLKNFLIVFFSLVAFFVFMDFMLNKDKLPDSTNLQVLYIFYKGLNASILIYPLSIIFAMVISVIGLVKKNEMIAFLSLGYSIKKLLFPFFSLAFLITSFFVSLQLISSTSFADQATMIQKGNYFTSTNTNLFFKFKNNIIFIKKLDVINKTAYDMKVFILNNDKVSKVYNIKKAKFKKNQWISDSVLMEKLNRFNIQKSEVKFTFLKGFKPYILDKLEKKEIMTLKIALQTLYLLKKEDIDINFLKTYIYNALIPPLTFIFLMVILFLKAPIHSRISNVSLYISVTLFLSVLLWGIFLLIRKMSIAGVLNPDIAFFSPLLIVLSLSIYYFRKI